MLPKLFKYDQSGFKKGLNIGYNIRVLLDVIDYANCQKVTGAVFSINLCKAYNSSKWPFIFNMIKLF